MSTVTEGTRRKAAPPEIWAADSRTQCCAEAAECVDVNGLSLPESRAHTMVVDRGTHR